jgi:hypothetical protein
MSVARFRIDNATGLRFDSRSDIYSDAGAEEEVLNVGIGKGAIIDSIYAHSLETTHTTRLVLSIMDVTGGNSTRRPFFVANLAPKETVLCASKSTPITIDNGQKITVANTLISSTGTAVDVNVYVYYREYDVT